jgi:hypothetical protein
MAQKKYDGVIEAVHYGPDGQVEWVRAYQRRGPAWSDRVILQRPELIREIQSGKKFMLGQRVQYMAGTFEVTVPVQVSGPTGKEILVTSESKTGGDLLEGAPVI